MATVRETGILSPSSRRRAGRGASAGHGQPVLPSPLRLSPRGRGAGVRGLLRSFAYLSLASVALAALGCSTTPTAPAKGNEPLFGECGPRGPAPTPPPPPPPAKTQAGVPPIPTAQFSPSTAALASGQGS